MSQDMGLETGFIIKNNKYMQKPDLSIIMPAIRPQNWINVYNSILNSTKRTFELIIASPYQLPKELENLVNIKLIKDYGSPVRASQIALSFIEGKYVYPTHSDDSLFIEGAIDKNLDFLISKGEDHNNVIMAKYSESASFSSPQRYQDDNYYKLVNAYKTNPQFVNSEWWIYNSIFMHSSYLLEMGGWDCSFQACPYSHADLAIRCQDDGAATWLSPCPISICDHGQDDHRPIEISQAYEDAPIFNHRYARPIDKSKNKIELTNWKNAESVWSKRFKT